jgi:2',3'-cyclic-nucleotide 2'-phosphodiesterase (5'-nucleotidase family)
MKRTARKLICLLFFHLSLPALLLAQQVSLTILHTNDTHGHLRPFSYPSVVSPGSELAALKERTDIGGIARRATLVKRLRTELERQGTTVWLVDAGDFSDGTPFSTEYHGEADAAAMNAAGYTFGALGNHEFNNPLSRLKAIIGMFRYPVLCANAIENSTGRPLTQTSEIRELGPLKIGIFALVTKSTSGYPAAKEGVTITGEIETAQRMVSVLRPEAGIVIAISHAGDQTDQQIAAAVPGVDVIIGGHSHARLPFGQLVWHSDELKSQEVNGTVVVQAHQWGGELGRLDLRFDRDDRGVWHVERYRALLIPITSDIPEDEAVAAVVDRYWKPIAPYHGEVLGQAAADFIERGDDLAPYNLVADAIRETFGVEIELENMGGVRAPLAKGKITRADLVDMDPFDNTIVTFKVSGRRLKEILQSEHPAVSGLRYRIETGKIVEATVAGRPLSETRIYTAAANSFLARTALKGIQVRNTGRQRLDVLIEYVRKKGTVRPVYDGRRVIMEP